MKRTPSHASHGAYREVRVLVSPKPCCPGCGRRAWKATEVKRQRTEDQGGSILYYCNCKRCFQKFKLWVDFDDPKQIKNVKALQQRLLAVIAEWAEE